jgi:hypothetical protein
MGDLLFQFTEWLRTTQLVELSIWIGETPLSLAIQTHFWAIPIIQTIHIAAIAGTFGSVLMINLRVLGLNGAGSSIDQTARRFVPWIWWGLLVLILSGLLLITGEPVRELINPVFWIKMGLVLSAALIALWFLKFVRRDGASWETQPGRRIAVRTAAVAIILLWCAIMVAGRWIAYAPV